MADDKTTKTPEQPVTDSGPGKGLPPHHPDACGLRTRIPGRTVLRATMARSPKAASFKRTAGKAVPLTA